MKSIVATYIVYSSWEMDEILEDLGISEEQIKSHYIKWDTLYLTYTDADGVEHTEEIEPNRGTASEDTDWKRPSQVEVE